MSSLNIDYLRKDSASLRGKSLDCVPAQPPLDWSPSELQQAIQPVKELVFSDYLAGWINRYETVGQRSRYLWQWCLEGIALTTMPSVMPELRSHVIETKLLGIMYCTLLDDIADREQDSEMLQMAMSLGFDDWPMERLTFWSGRRREYLEMIASVWNEVWGRCARYPRFAEFEQLLRFDTEQVFNSMRHSLLANQRPEILNVIENDLYQPHNMQIMFMASVDLCASPAFDIDDLSLVREVSWHTQRMGRIGNMVTTWEREVLDRDFTSGIFAHAVHLGIINGSELRELPAHEIMSRLEDASFQEIFLQEWKFHYDLAAQKIERIRSVDFKPYLDGFEQLLKLHLGSRGLL